MINMSGFELERVGSGMSEAVKSQLQVLIAQNPDLIVYDPMADYDLYANFLDVES